MSPEDVIRTIVERESRGEALLEDQVARSSAELVESARSCFGTWDSALAYAGIEDDHVVRERLLGLDAVRRRLRGKALAGSRLDHAYVVSREPNLVRAAVRQFGSWDSALEAAGIDSNRVARPPWGGGPSRDEILDAVRQRRAGGESMRWSDVAREDNTLANLARARFGSWGRALLAAGLAGGVHREHQPREFGE